MSRIRILFRTIFTEIIKILNFRVSVGAKITLPYGFLALIVSLGGAFLITQILISSIEQRFDNLLAETKEIAADFVVQEENQLLENLRLIGFLDGLDRLIQAENAENIREALLPIAYNNTLDFVSILNAEGISLLSLRRDLSNPIPRYVNERGSSAFVDIGAVRNVIDRRTDEKGDKFVELVSLGEEAYLIITGPVKDDSGNLNGVVVIGKAVRSLINEIRAQTLSQVTIYNFDGTILSSTLNEPPSIDSQIAAQIQANQDQETVNRSFSINDIGYKENLSMWEVRDRADFGVLGIASQTKYLTDTTVATRQNIFVLVTLTLFLILIVGITIARLITRPIHNLRDAALEVSAGNLQVYVDPLGDDEIALLTTTFNSMVQSLDASKKELVLAYDKTLEGWAKALELRDQETEGHTRRVTDLTLKLAKAYGIDGAELENIRRGALLHDMGKVGVSDNILLKPGRLTDEEFEEIKKHPVYASEMLSEISFLKDAIDIPYCHHEKWDGSGYPRGLKGEEIPLAARLFCIADVWDAITSDRPYRKAMSFDKAVEIIVDGKGTHFEPKIVDLFLKTLE